MKWDIDFISEEDFRQHIKNTIIHYDDKLISYNMEKFNNNIIDPIKMIFDKAVYSKSRDEVISNEIFRQRDKSNNNEIGYFHQRIFEYIKGCHVPANGQDGGRDVIFTPKNGYKIDNGDIVHQIFVEMKNKHNTMNSSASSKIYMKMQHQLLNNDDCACFLVETIAKHSQNVAWQTSIDHRRASHARIRRVSIDKFYEIITGESNAFYKICMVS